MGLVRRAAVHPTRTFTSLYHIPGEIEDNGPA
jgi:hypothetical protein